MQVLYHGQLKNFLVNSLLLLPIVLLNTRLVHISVLASEQQSSKMWHRLSQ